MFELTADLLARNDLDRGGYAEPFAGGAGLALSLLYAGHVSEVYINDLDPAVWSFWHSVLERTDELIDLISSTPVTINEWQLQRLRLQDECEPLRLGFAAFFLNRTNRSGVIKGGGAIGGLDQTGPYKIDCRFNVEDLTRRVRRVSRYSDRIHLTNLDALDFLAQSNFPERTLLFIDPPYFKKGPGLYSSYYQDSDHAELSDSVLALDRPWVVTYDDVPQIRRLYRDRRQFAFDIDYSLNEKRKGTELLIASKGLRVPEAVKQRQVSKPQYRGGRASQMLSDAT